MCSNCDGNKLSLCWLLRIYMKQHGKLLTWNSGWNLISPSFSSTDFRLSCDVITMSPPGLIMSLPVLVVRANDGQAVESPAFDQSESSDAGRQRGRGKGPRKRTKPKKLTEPDSWNHWCMHAEYLTLYTCIYTPHRAYSCKPERKLYWGFNNRH